MFRCNIRNLQRKQSAVIKIRARLISITIELLRKYNVLSKEFFFLQIRLWNATLVEDFPGIHTVRIRSKAHVSLDPSLEITQRTEDDFDYVGPNLTSHYF